MAKKKSTLIAIGGGELTEAADILDEIFGPLDKKPSARVTIMTVATNEPEQAADKYTNLFKSRGIKHIDIVDVSQRDDSFREDSIEKMKKADALFFSGGDQLNITSLIGGSPLHDLLHARFSDGVLIAGTSAGAAMMSNSMIISGASDAAPRVGGVEIAPGMDLVGGTIIDTHFSQRGRHGRLLTAIAHYPQVLGLGIDEKTAMVFRNGDFTVVGEGVVTVMDGSQMRYTDLPYRQDDETVGMFGAKIHVLPAGYSFNLKERRPIAPTLKKMAGASDGN